MHVGRKELDNLLGANTVESISPETKEKIKAAAKAAAKKCIELPSKGVFTIKPDKYKVRIGRIATTVLDTAMMRYLVSWGAASKDFTLASLDVTAAFLNAPLPEGRGVVLKPPSILYKLQLMPPGHVWSVRKAIYGLREAPNLWSEERTESLTKVRFTSEGEHNSEGEHKSVLISYKSLCLIVKTSSLLTNPLTEHLGLTNQVPPHEVVVLSGIYVDDYLTVGPPSVVESFMQTLRKKWKTSEPQYLTCDHELHISWSDFTIDNCFSASSCIKCFTLKISCKSIHHISLQLEHFKKDAPLPLDSNNPEHLKIICFELPRFTLYSYTLS